MKKTARAHTNIALVKYWGKKDQALKIPYNSSVSMTLDTFYTDTSYEQSANFTESQFYLNDELQTPAQTQRISAYIKELQERFELPQENFHIYSTNHVPTSAGLASSSSAFAALAYAFVGANQLKVDLTEVSRLARLGSGSASRSVFGGFAMWQKGQTDHDSFAFSLEKKPQLDLNLLAIELDFAEKKIASTAGMQHVVATSPFYQTWSAQADLDVQAMIAAIRANDFTQIGAIAECSAMSMHALNMTADPWFSYLTPTTLQAINLVQELRQNGVECYVTIDAGPNIKILCQTKNIKKIEQRFREELNNARIIRATFGPGVKYLD